MKCSHCSAPARSRNSSKLLRLPGSRRPQIGWSGSARRPPARLVQLNNLLGAGGMGEVYAAHDPRLKRDVAVKVLPAVFAADRRRLHRFEEEARAAAALNHPNILAVHDIGIDADIPFIVMERVPGETIAQCLTRRRPPVSEALAVGGEIADALAAAHARGIVHRDLKPANVMLTPEGHVKVLDFGVAKVLDPANAASTASDSGRGRDRWSAHPRTWRRNS